MHHRIDNVQLGFVDGRQLSEFRHVWPVLQPWYANHLGAEYRERAKHQEPGRIIDKNRVAGAGEFARHQIECLCDAARHDNLLWCGGNFQLGEFQLQLLP